MDWRKAKDKKGVDWREVRGWGECMREVSARGVGSTIMKLQQSHGVEDEEDPGVEDEQNQRVRGG